jgi:CheY-like chemotaxis protein
MIGEENEEHGSGLRARVEAAGVPIADDRPAVATVLVVDDQLDTGRLLVRMLELAGYAATCVTDGASAIASVAARMPAMVILDVTMPDLDGFDVLRAIRAAPASRAVPVVMFSALNDADSIIRASALGANEYVVKSKLRYAELRELVRRYLGAPREPTADAA